MLTAGAALRLSRLHKGFGGATAVHDVSLDVAAGSFLTLLGASGSGKSTTLAMIAGFLRPDSGTVAVDGRDITRLPSHRRGFGVVLQNYALFPHMSVFDNVAFPLKMRRTPREVARAQVQATLRLVQLERYADRHPRELSGGQQQRVALGRALAGSPRLLLMDEPLSALDRQLREQMQGELVRIQRRLGVTVVLVTHDQTEALVMSDMIAIMRDGRIEQFGSPRDIYDRPASRFVAEFIGESNFLPGIVASLHGPHCQVACGAMSIEAMRGAALTVGQAVQIAVRPERLKLGAAALGNRQDGTVQDVIYVGDALKIGVCTGSGQRLVVRAGRDDAMEALRPGDAVFIGWRPEDTVVIATSQ